ncbi:uncharacterized protein LOC143035058 isoform X2 [Oratosquilla oratoria]|uniref:uncharacterized protein LOC143035058 isoform X2 n=1 Tax=Oratosquilla oratoria TaxID=337810 RepID=UPI003F767329
MVRPQNGMMERRGGGRGRGQRGGRQFNRGQGGIQKPPPLMSRPLPPPPGIRRPPIGHHRGRGMGPPHMGMGPPGRMGPPGGMHPDGPHHHGRMGPPPPMVHHGRMGPPVPPRGRGRGMGPPMGGMMRGRGRGVMRGAPMPPPMGPPFPGPPGMMVPHRGRGRGRGRGSMRGGRGAAVSRRVKEKPPQKKNLQNEMNKPWITEAMKNEIMKKHKLHQKAKKSKSKEDWDAFKEQRNKVTTMIREAKLEYIGAHPEEDVEKILAEAANQGNKKGDEESNREASATSEAKEDKADAALDGQGAEAEHMEEVVDTPSEAEPAQAELAEAESPEAPATCEANGDTVEVLEPAEAV